MLMKKKITPMAAILLLLLQCIIAQFLNAQVTTATLSGIVRDSKGIALPSASITVEFPDVVIRQALITRADGRFTVSNLRFVGPYHVTVNHVNYQKAVS